MTKRASVPQGQYDGKSAQERSAARKSLLIETAIALFAVEGFASISLNRLCAEAGLTKRYFYESFDSMEAVLEQAFVKIFDELQQDLLQSIGAHSTPKAMIVAALQGFFTYLKQHPNRAKVFLIESLTVQGARASFFDESRVSAVLTSTSMQFIKQTQTPQPVLEVMAQCAVGAARFVGQKWIQSDYGQSIDILVQGVSEVCFGLAERFGVDLNKSLI